GTEGGFENGPAAVRRPPDRLRIALDMRPLTAGPARTVRPRPDRRPILIATKGMLISGTDTLDRSQTVSIYERLEAGEVGPDLRAGRFYGEVVSSGRPMQS